MYFSSKVEWLSAWKGVSVSKLTHSQGVYSARQKAGLFTTVEVRWVALIRQPSSFASPSARARSGARLHLFPPRTC